MYAMTGLDRLWRFQQVEAPRFQDSRHMNVVRLSALRTGRLSPKKIFLVFLLEGEWVNPRDIVLPEVLCQMKYSNDTTWNRTRDLPACSAVPQPNVPPVACPHNIIMQVEIESMRECGLILVTRIKPCKMSVMIAGILAQNWPGPPDYETGITVPCLDFL